MDPSYDGCVLIAHVETNLSATGDGNREKSRQELWLALYWNITMREPGTAGEGGGLGKTEINEGLALACFNQAKRLVELLAELIPSTDSPKQVKKLL